MPASWRDKASSASGEDEEPVNGRRTRWRDRSARSHLLSCDTRTGGHVAGHTTAPDRVVRGPVPASAGQLTLTTTAADWEAACWESPAYRTVRLRWPLATGVHTMVAFPLLSVAAVPTGSTPS